MMSINIWGPTLSWAWWVNMVQELVALVVNLLACQEAHFMPGNHHMAHIEHTFPAYRFIKVHVYVYGIFRAVYPPRCGGTGWALGGK